MIIPGQRYWRYHDFAGGIILEEYIATVATKHCVYVRLAAFEGAAEHLVRLYARKRFAYATKDEAWESFVARKRKQKQILAQQMQHLDTVLSRIEAGLREGPFEAEETFDFVFQEKFL